MFNFLVNKSLMFTPFILLTSFISEEEYFAKGIFYAEFCLLFWVNVTDLLLIVWVLPDLVGPIVNPLFPISIFLVLSIFNFPTETVPWFCNFSLSNDTFRILLVVIIFLSLSLSGK